MLPYLFILIMDEVMREVDARVLEMNRPTVFWGWGVQEDESVAVWR